MPRYYKQKLYTDEQQRIEIGIATLKRMLADPKRLDLSKKADHLQILTAATQNYHAKQKLNDGNL